MANSTYRPGSRKKKYTDDGRMSKNRLAWIRTRVGQAVIMYYEDPQDLDEGEDEAEQERIGKPEYGPTVRLMLPQLNGRTVFQDITALTMPELEMLREFYNLLFDLAEPSVRERDRIAQDAYAEGDDSYARSYRPVGQFVIRKGTIKPHSESVQRRLESLLEGTGDRRGFTRRVRGDGDELVDGESKEGSTQDDGTPPDEPESLREVGRLGASITGVQSTDSGEGDSAPSA